MEVLLKLYCQKLQNSFNGKEAHSALLQLCFLTTFAGYAT